MEKREKILIIKTGYSEFLEKENNEYKVSYGDVLRTTPLLHAYKGHDVTWVTDKKAFPLLEKNKYITRLLSYDFNTAIQLQSEEFDVVINLEKNPGICALSDNIHARKSKHGFTFNTQTGGAEALDKAFETLSISANPELKKQNKKNVQELLFEMIGKKWQGEEFILGYCPKTEEIYDVGLNTQIGEKWPTKAWSSQNWDELEKILINSGLRVSRQDKQGPEVLTNLYSYMDWINSCKLIVSNDSLGLYLAVALKKAAIGLFAPTSHRETYMYEKGRAILPKFIPDCLPCFKGICEKEKNCMEDISPERVYEEIKKMLKKESMEIPPEYKYISAFLTMRCNLNCSFCINSFDKSKEFNRTRFKEMSGEEWVKALNRIDSRQDVPISFSGGEPFLHPDFIYIINHLKPELKIDILTNLQWGDFGIQKFIDEVNPERIKRDSPYPSIRVSYHPEQMQNGETLVKNVKKLQDAGFSIGIYSVLYPSPEQLSAINQMQFRCKDLGIDFRLKEFLGEYQGQLFGDYSKYPGAVNSAELKNCLCKTSELLIAPDGKVYRCHRDLYHEENSIGSLTDSDFQIENKFRVCDKFGECNPCDVKVKTNYKQQLGHTSVEIRGID